MKCRTLTSISFLLLTALLAIVLTGCPFAPTPLLVVDKTSVTVPENATGTFQLKLSSVPTSYVTVNVARLSGDSDITVQSGASLTFTPANWSLNQTVTLTAAHDADSTNGTATLQCSASGLESVDLTATEADDDTSSAEGETSTNPVLVTFPDPALDAAIRTAIGIPSGPIHNTDLVGKGFTSLDASYEGISNLAGIEYCTDLTHLDLLGNQISDISGLSELTGLTELFLYNNQISDISGLLGLTGLTGLVLQSNQISDISGLLGLTGNDLA